ncbi:MAG: AI-2E family transporter, partial [Blautia sp.]|nr:AI-2E family transporter [Blautia sp.]
MKNEENVKFIKLGLTIGGIVAFGILFFFFVFHFDHFSGTVNMILSILRSFVYGCVIAYLVLPLSRKLEGLFLKLLGEKRKKVCFSIANVVALVIALLVVLAVMLLIVPQLINSIMGIVQAIPGEVTNLEAKVTELLENDPELMANWEKLSAEITAKVNAFFQGDVVKNVMNLVGGAAIQVA